MSDDTIGLPSATADAPVPSKDKKPDEAGRLTVSDAERTTMGAMVRSGVAYKLRDGREERLRLYSDALRHMWGKPQEDTPVVNLIAARTRVQPAKLALNDPTFEVKAVERAPYPNSEGAWAAWLALTWDQENIGATQRDVTLHAPALGMGIGFVGYEKAESGEIIDASRRLFGIVGADATERVARVIGKGATDAMSARVESSVKIELKERMFCETVTPFDLIIDPCAQSLKDATYMARRIHLSLARARMMFGVDCPDANSIANVALFVDSENGGANAQGDLASKVAPEVKRVAAWELWNMTTRQTAYIDSNYKVIGSKERGWQVYEWRSAHPGFPEVILTWDEMIGTALPEGLMAAGHTLNAEINGIRKRSLAEMAKSWTKWLTSKTLSPEARKALLSQNDDIVQVDELDSIQVLKTTAVPPELFSVEDRAKADFNEVTNTSPFDAGSIPAGAPDTATAASLAQSSSDAVTSWRQMAVERWAQDVAERLVAGASACMNETIVVRIENRDEMLEDKDAEPIFDAETGTTHPAYVPLGTMIDYDFKPVDHAGRWRIRVQSGSMAANAKSVEQQQLMQVLSLAGGVPGFNTTKFLKHIISTFTSIKNVDQFFDEPAPAPEQPGADVGAPDESGLPPAGTGAEQGQPMLPPAGGSGNPDADLAASMMGQMAPMTGDNGMGGSANLAGIGL